MPRASADVVRTMYDGFAAGDIDRAVSVVHPDVEWVELFPYAGTYVGADALLELLNRVSRDFDLDEWMVDGDRVVVLGSYGVGRKGREQVFESRFVHVFWVLPPREDSVERWAKVATSLLDALEIEHAAVVGHHTGAYVATELAACRPERVSALVLSSMAISSEEERRGHASGRAVVDDVDPAPDGSHVRELWRLRAAMYPPDTDLLERYLIDYLRAGPRAAGGHRVVAAYPSERRVAELACPTLLIGATADPHAYPALGALRAALPQAKCVEIEGGMVPLPDQLPAEFAAAVAEFLDEVGV